MGDLHIIAGYRHCRSSITNSHVVKVLPCANAAGIDRLGQRAVKGNPARIIGKSSASIRKATRNSKTSCRSS